MKHFYQSQENDCGIAVMQMLVNHFHKITIPKAEFLKKINLCETGVNLNEFEILGNEYGLEFESYGCKFNEFENIYDKRYYVILFKNNNYLHYVISKRKNKLFYLIYDPEKGIYELTLNSIKEKFANILIKVFPTKLNNFSLNKKMTVKNFFLDIIKGNLKKLLITLFLGLISVFLSIIISQNVKFLINDVIAQGTTKNMMTYIVIFSSFILLEIVLSYLLRILQQKLLWISGTKLLRKLELKLINKKFIFYEKFSEATIIKTLDSTYEIAEFVLIKSINFLTSLILMFFLISILSKISYFFVIFSFVIILINLLLEFVSSKQNVKHQINDIKINEKQIKNWYSLISYLTSEQDEYKKQLKLNELYEISNKNKDYFFSKNLFFNKLGIFHQTLEKTFSLIILVISSILIVNYHLIALSDMIAGISVVSLFISNFNSVTNFFFVYKHIKLKTERYINCFFVDNIENNKNAKFKIKNTVSEIILKNLSWEQYGLRNWKNKIINIKNDTLIIGDNRIGKSTLAKTICNKIKQSSGEILIDNFSIELYKNFSNNAILLNYKSTCTGYMYEKLIEYISNNLTKFSFLSEILQEMCLLTTDPNNFSNGQRQLLNWIYLLQHKNKIIICDESLNSVSDKFKEICFSIIKPIIIKSNFLIVIEHDKNINRYFNHVLNLS